MTTLESASASWNALHFRPECRVPLDPSGPMGGCIVRFAPDGRVVLVFSGTYSAYADDPSLIREILSIQSVLAEECRKAVAAKAAPPITPARQKLSLDDLELEF